MTTLGVATLGWWGVAVLAPALLARRALSQGKRYLERREYDRALRCLRRAARHPKLSHEAATLMAETAVRQGRPESAISALDAILPPDERTEPGLAPSLSRHGHFLLGIAYSMLGRGTAAESEMAEVTSHPDTTPVELLAAAQACLIARDLASAERLLEGLSPERFSGTLRGRFLLCKAAVFWHQRAFSNVLTALPPAEACEPADRELVERLRRHAEGRASRRGAGAGEVKG